MAAKLTLEKERKMNKIRNHIKKENKMFKKTTVLVWSYTTDDKRKNTKTNCIWKQGIESVDWKDRKRWWIENTGEWICYFKVQLRRSEIYRLI